MKEETNKTMLLSCKHEEKGEMLFGKDSEYSLNIYHMGLKNARVLRDNYWAIGAEK